MYNRVFSLTNIASDPALIRSVSLFFPIGITCVLWYWRKPDHRLATACLLACLWNLPPLLFLHGLAQQWGWWHFEAQGGLFLGIPVDLYLGWALVWGAIPLLAFRHISLIWVSLLILYLDLLLMPYLQPILQLDRNWIFGEAIGLLLCFLPAQWLGRWTFSHTCLKGRVWLQFLMFSGWLGLLLPAMIVESSQSLPFSSDHLWHIWQQRPLQLNLLSLQCLFLLAVPGLTAVQEFAQRGQGTPLPFDPPRHLVTTGVYAYLANPMQVSGCLILLGMGLWAPNGWFLIGSLIAVAYNTGLAQWHEGVLYDTPEWHRYRRNVRSWWFHWRPSILEESTLYVAETCSICHSVGVWLNKRQPIGLKILPAESTAKELKRLTYYFPNGDSVQGMVAFSRALDHLNLGWAFIGWIIRLPIICQLAQLLCDVSGGGPQHFR